MSEIEGLVESLRKRLTPRNEHHPCCSVREKKVCDCYARQDHRAHGTLDRILQLFKGEGVNSYTERMLRLNGKQPTIRDRWKAFYRLWRISKKIDDERSWPDHGPMDALRMLGFGRYVAMANGREQEIGGRGHWPVFLRRRFLDMERRKRREAERQEKLGMGIAQRAV